MTEIIKKSAGSLARSLVKGELTSQAIGGENIGKLLIALADGGPEALSAFAEISPPETYQSVIEMAFWDFDRFSSSSLLNWLTTVDEPGSLAPFAKFLKNIDFQYLELLIREKVLVYAPDEPEDQPPGDGFYSPDNGQIWLKFVEVDEHETRLLGRLLALLFQTDTKLFYSLITAGSASSKTELEESCYRKHLHRASNLGFPEPELAWEAHKLLKTGEALTYVRAGSDKTICVAVDNKSLTGVHSENLLTSYLSSVNSPELHGTLAYITNSAVVVHKVSMLQPGELSLLVEQVYGTLNLGLELLCKAGLSLSSESLDPNLVILGAYRLGYSELSSLRRKAEKLKGKITGEFSEKLLKALARQFPLNINVTGSDTEKVSFQVKPFASSKDLEDTSEIVAKLASS